MESQKLKLELTVEQLNVVLAALGKQSLESVFSVFTVIQKQVEVQMSQQQTPTESDV